MSKLVIRGVMFDEKKRFAKLLIGYHISDDPYGYKNSVQFECDTGAVYSPSPLDTTVRMTNGAYLGFTHEMEPKLMKILSPAVNAKLMELLQKQTL